MPSMDLDKWDRNGKVTRDDFVFSYARFPMMYQEAMSLWQDYEAKVKEGAPPKKKYFKPAEQLSPKGLCLLAYLSYIKDKEAGLEDAENQPLIVTDIGDYDHLIELLAKAKPGTSVTTIHQKVGGIFSFDSYHKTTIKFERHEDKIVMISLDAAQDYRTVNPVYKKVKENIKKINKTAGKEDSRTLGLEVLVGQSPFDKSIQKDMMSCAIFAWKFAKIAKKYPSLIQDNQVETFEVKNRTEEQKGLTEKARFFEFTAEFLKGAQSRQEAVRASERFQDDVVSRKEGKNLTQSYERHPDLSYIQDFSSKYLGMVDSFLEENKDKPEVIKDATQMFSLRSLTAERLERVYGPKERVEQKTKHSKDR